MKIGDKVRFLNEIGGGIVTGFRGKDIVLVEDADGFDIPMPIRECVVIDTDDYNMTRPVPKATPKKWDICLSLKFLLFVSRKCVVGMC